VYLFPFVCYNFLCVQGSQDGNVTYDMERIPNGISFHLNCLIIERNKFITICHTSNFSVKVNTTAYTTVYPKFPDWLPGARTANGTTLWH